MALTTSKRTSKIANGPVREYLRELSSAVANEAPPDRRRGGHGRTSSVVRDALRRRTRRT